MSGERIPPSEISRFENPENLAAPSQSRLFYATARGDSGASHAAAAASACYQDGPPLSPLPSKGGEGELPRLRRRGYEARSGLERRGHFNLLAGSNHQVLTLGPDGIVEEQFEC
jgi:hypothetical protein